MNCIIQSLCFFSIVIAASLCSFLPAVQAAEVCSKGAGLPPFLSSGADPNLLLVLDNSGSMLDMAYIDANSQCFDDTYDSRKEYTGNFESKSWYKWTENPGNFYKQWTAGACYKDGSIVYDGGAFHKATCQFAYNCDTNGDDIMDGCTENSAYLGEPISTASILWDSPTAPEWVSGKVYATGDFVTYERQVYKNKSGTSNIPPAQDSVNWQSADYTWDGNKAYSMGDIVSYKGMIFKASSSVAAGRNSSSLYDDRTATGDFKWTRLDEGYFEKIEAIASDSCASPSYTLPDLQITLYSSGSKIFGSTPPAADEVKCFRATGNFLNWASASKFDIQKKILTGGKYSAGYEVQKIVNNKSVPDNSITTDTEDDRLIQESRGCAGKSFVKQITLNTGADASKESDDVKLTLRIRGSSASDQVDATDDRTRIEIFATMVGGFDDSACQRAYALLQDLGTEDKTALQNAVLECTYGADPPISQQVETIYNRSVMDCWQINKGSAPSASGELKNHCQSIYDGTNSHLPQQYPWAITAWDPFYICYGEYDSTLATKGKGFIGRCWAELPSSNCNEVTCTNDSSDPIKSLNANATGFDKFKCSGGKAYKCIKNICQARDWYIYYQDLVGNECSTSSGSGTRVCEDIEDDGTADYLPCWTEWAKVGTTGYKAAPVTPAAWASGGGGTDACIEYAEYDYCQGLGLPEVIDPSDQVFATGDTYNIPAALIDTGIYTQLNVKKPLQIMAGYLKYTLPDEQNSASTNLLPHDTTDRPDGPRGVLYDVAEDLRIGVMTLNANGSRWECDNLGSTDPSITKYCPIEGNKDGASVISQIEEGMVKLQNSADPTLYTEDWNHFIDIVSKINSTPANAWTPLAEAMYTALSYYGQNKNTRLNPTDFQSSTDTVPWPDPVQYWCQDNHVLIITEGASTNDVHQTVADFANDHGDNDPVTEKGICDDGLNGSTYFDDITYFGQNATVKGPSEISSDLYSKLLFVDNETDPNLAYAKQPVTTHIVTTGSLRAGGTGECSAATLMTNAAKNGGSTLLTGENPAQLEANLKAVLSGILGRASAGSAASVISSSRSGEGAVYQAVFWPQDPRGVGKDPRTWIGDVHGLFIDSQGRMWDDYIQNSTLWSEDSDGDGHLDAGEDLNSNNCLDGDRRVFFFYDDENSKICFNESAWKTGSCDTTLTDYCGSFTEPVPIKEFQHYLWSAKDKLEDTEATYQVLMTTTANRDVDDTNGRWVWNTSLPTRYIFTWNDLNNNGIVDGTGVANGEVIPVDDSAGWGGKSTTHHSILKDFRVADAAEMKHFSDWLRGHDWHEDANDDGVFDPGEDANLNGVLDSGEDANGNGVLDLKEDVNNNGVFDYVYRCRKADCGIAATKDSSNPEWRLGDVVHSTPKLVAQPAEAFHTIYRDGSYAKFVKRHRYRRNVIYFGANDGMLHAVNGGFYNEEKNKFYKNMTLNSTTKLPEYSDSGPDLGTEIWAYVPYNLQPHLKCLTDPLYGSGDGNSHKYYVDKEPRIFDMQIFTEEAACSDPYSDNCIHPDGWGTILVGAMRFGGAPITAATEGWSNTDNRQFISSYFILDITDPERPPKLLGEMTRTTELDDTVPKYADLGFSVPMPSGVVMREATTSTTSKTTWYLVFGNGPTSLKGENSKQGGVAVLPLELDSTGVLKNGFRILNAPPTASASGVIPFKKADNTTDSTTRFISDMMTVDYDLEAKTDPVLGALYKSDAVYFGTVDGSGFVEDSVTGLPRWLGGGGVYRLVTRKISEGKQVGTTPGEWYISKLIDTKAPVTGGLSVGWDLANFWIYAGTGRFFTADDKTDPTVNRFFGVKEPLNPSCEMTWGEINWSSGLHPELSAGSRGLFRTDNIQVADEMNLTLDGKQLVFCPGGSSTDIEDLKYCSLGALGSPLETTNYYPFADLLEYIAGEKRTANTCPQADDSIGVDGWYRVLQDERERVIGQAALLGGLTTFTSYQPYDDICIAEGVSSLYGVHYQTGTAWYQNVFGTVTRDGVQVVKDKLSLGSGLATTPSMHSGGSGSDAKAFVQSSTGEIIEIEQENLPIQPPKSGKSNWCDDCD